ncbi:MAG: NfeD family protein [Firmicutes bacterium]|nr:NfeD family protein [Bacillota bacterium]
MSSLFWLIVFIGLVVIELLTVGLVSVWFATGAVAAFITSYFTNNAYIQTSIFVVISILSLIITRPILKKYFNKDIVKTNVNKLIGETAIVIEELSKTNIGKVKVDGQIWSALNSEKGKIRIDSEVEILSIEGVKLIVRKKED